MRPVDVIELRPSDRGCGACGEVFGSMSDFTAHQNVNYRRRPPVRCRRPEELGLVQDRRGIWRTPAAIARLAAAADRLRAAQRMQREYLGVGSEL